MGDGKILMIFFRYGVSKLLSLMSRVFAKLLAYVL